MPVAFVRSHSAAASVPTTTPGRLSRPFDLFQKYPCFTFTSLIFDA